MDLQFPWLEKRDTQLGKYSVEKLLLFRFATINTWFTKPYDESLRLESEINSPTEMALFMNVVINFLRKCFKRVFWSKKENIHDQRAPKHLVKRKRIHKHLEACQKLSYPFLNGSIVRALLMKVLKGVLRDGQGWAPPRKRKHPCQNCQIKHQRLHYYADSTDTWQSTIDLF